MSSNNRFTVLADMYFEVPQAEADEEKYEKEQMRSEETAHNPVVFKEPKKRKRRRYKRSKKHVPVKVEHEPGTLDQPEVKPEKRRRWFKKKSDACMWFKTLNSACLQVFGSKTGILAKSMAEYLRGKLCSISKRLLSEHYSQAWQHQHPYQHPGGSNPDLV